MRVLDVVFFIYFASHIPITIFIDLQALLPTWVYPRMLVELKDWYCVGFKDPMMVDPPAWFLSFIYCEALLQFPFFLIATYAYRKGAESCRWIRIPAIVYGSHVATTVWPIVFHILLHKFPTSPHPGPQTSSERSHLLLFYLPYLLVPLLLLGDCLFSQVYRSKSKSS